MALFTVGSVGAFDFTQIDLTGFQEGEITTSSPTAFTIVDLDGFQTDFTGVGFTYDVLGDLTGGTVTGMTGSDGGPPEYTLTGASGDVATLSAFVDANDGQGFASTLLVGDDTVNGNSFNDVLLGYDGNDVVNGLNGDDRLLGGNGADTLTGGSGDDTLRGEDGNDFLFAGLGKDRAEGGLGDDLIRTSNSNDTLIGDAGADTLGAGSGGDLMRGGDDADLLLASNGNDRLNGDAGNDTMLGGGGRDTLTGGAGDDRLVGGTENDRFNFAPGSGADLIVDFGAGAASGDVIGLIGFGAAFDSFAEVIAVSTQVGANVVIDLGGGDTITLQAVTLGALNAGDFAFG